MNILCRFGIHDWGDWQLTHIFAYDLYQSSRCKRCNSYKQKSVGFCRTDRLVNVDVEIKNSLEKFKRSVEP